MIVDKPDLQFNNFVLPSQGSSNNLKPNQLASHLSKLPKLFHAPHQLLNISHSEVTTPKLSLDSSPPVTTRAAKTGLESAVNRGPKVYNKNLPEVFLLNTPGTRRIRIQRDPQKLRGNDRPETSGQISFEAQFHTPETARDKSNERDFMSPPLYIDKVKKQLSNKRPHSYQKYSHDYSIEEHISISDNKKDNHTPKNWNVDSYPETNRFTPRVISARRHKANPSNELINYSSEAGLKAVKSGSDKSFIKHNDEFEDQIKQILDYKKMFANITKSKFFVNNEESNNQKAKIEKNNARPNSTPPLQLNELITLNKIRNTNNNGVIKRMLHAPTFKMLDVQEEPLSELGSKENLQLKDWLSLWKTNFSTSKYLAHVYWCFWNSPEGCVSILTEPAINGLLSEVLSNYGGLPEKCVQNAARDLLKGINEIHKKVAKPHGNINPAEIMISRKGTVKLMPGVSQSLSGGMHNSLGSANFIQQEFRRPSSQLKIQKVQNDLRPLTAANSFQNFIQDTFDYGFTLLQCAIGDLSLYDSTNSLTWANVKAVLTTPSIQKNSNQACCLIHSEEIVRKAIKSIKLLSGSNKSRKELGINFDRSSSPVAKNNYINANNEECYIPLLEILKCQNHFSETFENFLCCCLRLSPHQRWEAKNLVTHKFLSEEHEPNGPLLTIKELLGIEEVEDKIEGKGAEGGNISKKHLEKLGEALRVVFLNKSVQDKFDLMLRKANRKDIDERKLVELAKELDVSIEDLERVIRNSIDI